MRLDEKVRPGDEVSGAAQVAGQAETIVSLTADRTSEPRRVDVVRDWLLPVMQRAAAAGEIPLAGSPEWASLPPVDIRRFAAVARAALAWLADSTDEAIAERLRDELEVADLLARHAVAGASRDVAAAMAELRPNAAEMVPFAELQRRRGELLGVAS